MYQIMKIAFTYLIKVNIVLQRRKKAAITKTLLAHYLISSLINDQIQTCPDIKKNLQMDLAKRQPWSTKIMLRLHLCSWLNPPVLCRWNNRPWTTHMVGTIHKIWNKAVTKWVLDWELVASSLLKKIQHLILNFLTWQM